MVLATIRPVLPADYPRWKALWDGCNAFYGREGSTALPADVTQMTWSRFADSHEAGHGLVAERSGELLGLAHFLFHRSTTQLYPTCYLQDLFTVEAARGTGVGRALVAAVCERAKAAGSQRLYWHTQETNVVAMWLYDKLGQKSGFIVYTKQLWSRLRPASSTARA